MVIISHFTTERLFSNARLSVTAPKVAVVSNTLFLNMAELPDTNSMTVNHNLLTILEDVTGNTTN